ncbi:hypothetical protein OSB04_006193 [Centaurea solstitialis]|uniref:FAR1 domain-containing protein n=1 Tax=Centaurea solstitialis TaxID=347529 RepID=A0AA38TQ12_9ASTR|nr:hypothetical protein OSB04_006193 [Centaurea solstitialis]
MESNADEYDEEHSKAIHVEEKSSMGKDHNMEEFNGEEGKAISSCRYITTDGLQRSNEMETFGGSKFWIPKVEDDVKPILGSVFQSLDNAIEMYANYAKKGGFKIRRSTQKTKRDGSVILKYILCSKAGLLENHQNGNLNQKRNKRQRNMRFQRTGCKACAKFKLIPGTTSYRLYSFEDKHNHALITKDNMNLTRAKRELDAPVDGKEANKHCDKLAHDAYSIVDYCIGKLSDDKEKLDLFVRRIHDLKNEVETGFLDQRAHKKEDVIGGSFIGISLPEVVAIHNPIGTRNEGCSYEKRPKSSNEKGINESSKFNRMCKRCWKIAGHDSRNCPLKNVHLRGRLLNDYLDKHLSISFTLLIDYGKDREVYSVRMMSFVDKRLSSKYFVNGPKVNSNSI